MANYADISAAIAAAIFSNDNEEITGDVLQAVLLDMVTTFGEGYQFKGIASPGALPTTPDAKVWYLAPAGTYENYGASANAPFIVAEGQVGIIRWDTDWTRDTVTLVEVVDNLIAGGANKALSAEMGKYLASIIGDLEEAVDLSQLTEQQCALGATAWYYSSSRGKHKAIPVTPGDKYSVRMVSYDGHTSGNYNGWYVFVTSSYSPPYSNGNAIPSTGEDVRFPAPVGQNVAATAPSNAAYLIITTQDGAGVYPVWEVTRQAMPDETVLEALTRISAEVEDLDETVGGDPQEVTATWGSAQVATSATPDRVFWICNARTVAGGVVTVKISDYSNYKIGVVVQNGTAWTSPTISDTGWKQQDIVKTIGASEAGYNIRVSIGKVANTDITVSEALAVLTQLSFVYTAGAGGLVERVGKLEEASQQFVQRIPMEVLGTTVYAGSPLDVAEHRYEYAALGSLTSAGTARQGAAVSGDYLFQCHNTNNAIVVFKLSTGQSIQTISLTPNASNHANSASFGGQYYDASDPFPCLYVSSEGESKSYVYRITGTEGAFSATLVQELSYIVPYFYPNLHVDAPNNRGVVVGYAANSWQSASGNKMMCCCFDLPAVTAGNTTLAEPYNEFSFPFIYATQGAMGKYGKLYHAFGNTSEGLAIGGIIVVDYILHTVETFIDLKGAGDFEPEGLGIWDGALVVTTQGGSVIKISPVGGSVGPTGDPGAIVTAEVLEDGVYFVDSLLNIGASVDNNGINGINLLTYEEV